MYFTISSLKGLGKLRLIVKKENRIKEKENRIKEKED